MSRVLVIEDEDALAQALRRGLRDEGLVVDVAADGDAGWVALTTHTYDLAIVDVMLPGISGIDVVKRLRRQKHTTPVLLLTARHGTTNVVQGLDAGANDYMTKPFVFEELMARVRALLRAAAGVQAAEVHVGPLVINTAGRNAHVGAADLTLTAKEYSLLEYLALHTGQVLSKARLIAAVWEGVPDFDPNTVEVFVANVRRKLERAGAGRLIHTVRGLGYSLRPDVAP